MESMSHWEDVYTNAMKDPNQGWGIWNDNGSYLTGFQAPANLHALVGDRVQSFKNLYSNFLKDGKFDRNTAMRYMAPIVQKYNDENEANININKMFNSDSIKSSAFGDVYDILRYNAYKNRGKKVYEPQGIRELTLAGIASHAGVVNPGRVDKGGIDLGGFGADSYATPYQGYTYKFLDKNSDDPRLANQFRRIKIDTFGPDGKRFQAELVPVNRVDANQKDNGYEYAIVLPNGGIRRSALRIPASEVQKINNNIFQDRNASGFFQKGAGYNLLKRWGYFDSNIESTSSFGKRKEGLKGTNNGKVRSDKFGGKLIKSII